MAGRGFYVNFKVPELDQAVKDIGKYDAKTALKIENQIQESTRNIRRGVLSRIHDVSGYLRKHTTSNFNRLKLEGVVREKAPHAHLVEFGHAGPAPAPEHPTMRPAFEEERPNLIRGLSEAVKP
jgi:HK97 gp10 family phage protein